MAVLVLVCSSWLWLVRNVGTYWTGWKETIVRGDDDEEMTTMTITRARFATRHDAMRCDAGFGFGLWLWRVVLPDEDFRIV